MKRYTWQDGVRQHTGAQKSAVAVLTVMLIYALGIFASNLPLERAFPPTPPQETLGTSTTDETDDGTDGNHSGGDSDNGTVRVAQAPAPSSPLRVADPSPPVTTAPDTTPDTPTIPSTEEPDEDGCACEQVAGALLTVADAPGTIARPLTTRL